LTVPDPPRGACEGRTEGPTVEPLRQTLSALAHNATYVGTVLGYAAYTFAVGGLAVWMPTYLERVRGLDLARADFLVGSVTVAAGLGGTFAGGYLGDFLSRRLRHGPLWLSGVSALLAVFPAWLALTAPSSVVYQGAFFAAEFLLFVSTGPINVVIVSAVHVSTRAMAMAVSIFTIHALGDAISPP